MDTWSGSGWTEELPSCMMLPRIQYPVGRLKNHLQSRVFRRLSHIGILDLRDAVNMIDLEIEVRLDFYLFDLLREWH